MNTTNDTVGKTIETSPPEEEASSGNPLSDNQERVIYLLNTFAAVLSMVGSFLILKIVYNSKQKKRRLSVYDRLLFALSICDFLSSLNWATGVFLVPQGDRVWAFGNEATCSAFSYIGVTVIISLVYSSMISLYYALLVRYGYRDEQLGGKIEIIMHAMCIIWPLTGYTFFLVAGAFAPRTIGLGCYLLDYPENCVDITKGYELEEGQVPCRQSMSSIVSSLPAFFATIVIVVCNMIIFCHVRASIQQYQKKAFARWENATGFFESPTEEPSSQTAKKDENSLRLTKNLFRFGRKEKASSSQKLTREISGRDSQMQQVRAVLNQSLFYVGSMALVNIPMCAQFVVGGWPNVTRENESELFAFVCFTTFMTPLQGIFNLLIFCRPTYLRVRKSFPNESRLKCFVRTIEAGTSDNRGGKRRRHAAQLRPLPSPRKTFASHCTDWTKRLLFSLGRNKTASKEPPSKYLSPKPVRSELDEANNENPSLDHHSDNLTNIDDNAEIIQLEMMEELSSASSSTKGFIPDDNAIDIPAAPDVEDIDDNNMNLSDNHLQDWHNIEFDSSCVPFFSSTTSTIEA